MDENQLLRLMGVIMLSTTFACSSLISTGWAESATFFAAIACWIIARKIK